MLLAFYNRSYFINFILRIDLNVCITTKVQVPIYKTVYLTAEKFYFNLPFWKNYDNYLGLGILCLLSWNFSKNYNVEVDVISRDQNWKFLVVFDFVFYSRYFSNFVIFLKVNFGKNFLLIKKHNYFLYALRFQTLIKFIKMSTIFKLFFS